MSREGDVRSVIRQLEKATGLIQSLTTAVDVVCATHGIEGRSTLRSMVRAADNMQAAIDRFKTDTNNLEDATLRDLS